MAILWKPNIEQQKESRMHQFMQWVNDRLNKNIRDYQSLYQWSINDPSEFWQSIWQFFSVIAQKEAKYILEKGDLMQDAQWFIGAKLNLAENLLRYRDAHPALIAITEDGHTQSMTYEALYTQVAGLAIRLRSLGIKPGDRIIGILCNTPDAVIAMLATASIGAVWSACSPDFGLASLIDRFQQIEPKILFAVSEHTYKGKTYHHQEKIQALQNALPSLIFTIWMPQDFENFEALEFESVPFDHPAYILYSSGTTGKPKGIVHSVGGTLIQHLKELGLHTNLHREDRFFFFTTCGWMMWNWLVSGLAIGATLVLYDGHPFYPTPDRLFNLIDIHKITVAGVSAKFLEYCEKFNLAPKNSHDLSSLKILLTTGSTLLPESFDYVYRDIKSDIQLSSISGGSDIISCFAIGNPLLPVYRGELQCIGLGMNVHIFDESGESIIEKPGELVCTSPFPSMPIYFWNDPGGNRYHDAYFSHFPNIWAHGDYAEITKHGGLIIYGRSDATLNPGGIRIGTAEIYQALAILPEILESLAVGQKKDHDEKIILFVVLKETQKLTDALIEKIKTTLRTQASPRHVPSRIVQVSDLPRTKNGKVSEIAVKKILHHEEIKNLSALENPEVLEEFRNF